MLAVVGVVGILGSAGGAALLAFVLLPWHAKKARERQYPLVTKQGLRVAKIPVRSIKLLDVDRAVAMFIDRAVAHGEYRRSALLTELGQTYLTFIRAVNETNERYIVDAYGRKIAGDNDGRFIRVVVLDGDTLGVVALFHELGHMAHETKKKVDYDHTDDRMWHEIVGWCKKAFTDG